MKNCDYNGVGVSEGLSNKGKEKSEDSKPKVSNKAKRSIILRRSKKNVKSQIRDANKYSGDLVLSPGNFAFDDEIYDDKAYQV